MHTPREFFDVFVQPAVDDWRRDKLDERRAIVAVVAIDNLAEHFAKYFGRDEKSERARLGRLVPSLQIAWDMHDTHKHGKLSRKSATIKRGQRPITEEHDGAFSDAFDGDAFDTTHDELVIELDAGPKYPVEKVVEEGRQFWEEELKRNQL
jgi:hypothetical protein